MMKAMRKIRNLICHLGFTCVAAAHAQPTGVYELGQFVGADGIAFQGQTWAVRLHDTSCSLLFSGCDELSDLDFQGTAGQDLAWALNSILFEQVINSDPALDASPNLTYGCEAPNTPGLCVIQTPIARDTGNGAGINQGSVKLYNYGAGVFEDLGYDGLGIGTTLVPHPPGFTTGSTADLDYAVYAKWTLVSSVPEPSTAAMWALGFGLCLALAPGTASQRRRLSQRLL